MAAMAAKLEPEEIAAERSQSGQRQRQPEGELPSPGKRAHCQERRSRR